MVTKKHSSSFYLSPDAHKLLALLAAKMGISKTSALEIAIRLLAKEQSVALEQVEDK